VYMGRVVGMGMSAMTGATGLRLPAVWGILVSMAMSMAFGSRGGHG